jgi:hypothetical protein
MASMTNHTLTAMPTAFAAARPRLTEVAGGQRPPATGCATEHGTKPMSAASYVSDQPAGNGFVAILSHRPHGSLEPSP